MNLKYFIDEILPYFILLLFALMIGFIGDNVSSIKNQIKNITAVENDCIYINGKIFCEMLDNKKYQ